MTSTPVKDVGSVLSSLTTSIGSNVKIAAGGGFQTVLNSQTGKEAADTGVENAQTNKLQTDKNQEPMKKTPGDSLKAKDEHSARVADNESAEGEEVVQKEPDEIPRERLERMMELLATAAAELMQQITDTFDISLEELRNIMQELGMDALDVLDQGKLGELLLKLGGAEDVYALVTDGELYENYQELMGSLDELLQKMSQELDVSLEQLKALFQSENAEPAEDVSADGTVREPDVVVQEAPTAVRQPETLREVKESEKPQGPEQAFQPVTEAVKGPAAEEANRQTDAEAGKRQGESDRKEHPQLFAQTLRTEQMPNQFDAQVQQTTPSSNAWNTDTQDIMRQIMDYMRIQVGADVSNLEMQLHPESLGTLHIQVVSKGGVLTANFITQNEAVKAALESQMIQLKESFEQQGVKVEAIEVTVQSHAFERNLDQGRGQSNDQGQEAKRPRIRRINLENPLEVESLEEEDALAAEMMAASGSQVDYTV